MFRRKSQKVHDASDDNHESHDDDGNEDDEDNWNSSIFTITSVP